MMGQRIPLDIVPTLLSIVYLISAPLLLHDRVRGDSADTNPSPCLFDGGEEESWKAAGLDSKYQQ